MRGDKVAKLLSEKRVMLIEILEDYILFNILRVFLVRIIKLLSKNIN